jgi:DNA-binding PadR family transcriptional regulator
MFGPEFWQNPERGHGHGVHFGPPWMRGRSRRRFKRGMLKYVLLRLIADGPRHGYDLMKCFGERGWGALAAGTLYPLLDKLEQMGYVQSREEDGRRIYTITDAGKERLRGVADHIKDEFNGEESDEEDAGDELRDSFRQLSAAVSQIGHGTSPQTLAGIVDVLKRARKEIYTLLANE